MSTLLIALALSVPVILDPAPPPESPQGPGASQEVDQKSKKPYKVGSKVEGEIVLEDLAGKKVSLFETTFTEGEGKLVTMVFWSLRDPRSHKYRKRLEAYQKQYLEKGVNLYLVVSSYDEIFSIRRDPLEDFRKFVKKEKFTLPILIDHGNKIADDFKALTSNHAFVIDRKHYLRYQGGIDDDADQKRKDKENVRQWLRDATDSLLAGKTPKDTISRPVGRKIKRAPKKK